MRQITPIFNREFFGYFRSPVAYVFLIVFLFASVGLAFFAGGFFKGRIATLESYFYFHPWLFLFLVPAAGMRLWRNNVGAFHDEAKGIHVRFGLANDSKQVNSVIKSGDLIGIRPRVITLGDVGATLGQFVSLECKNAHWKYRGTEHERAQEAWAALVMSLGGIARFVSGVEGVPR